jgi:hypothetical protein
MIISNEAIYITRWHVACAPVHAHCAFLRRRRGTSPAAAGGEGSPPPSPPPPTPPHPTPDPHRDPVQARSDPVPGAGPTAWHTLLPPASRDVHRISVQVGRAGGGPPTEIRLGLASRPQAAAHSRQTALAPAAVVVTARPRYCCGSCSSLGGNRGMTGNDARLTPRLPLSARPTARPEGTTPPPPPPPQIFNGPSPP